MFVIAQEPYVSLFIIIFFGILLSKIQIKGIGLGSSSVVISAIFFGHFGLTTPPSIEKIGLILFIFAVGIQAGPGFFESFKTGEARQYLFISGITTTIVFTLLKSITFFMGFDNLLTAGLFAGVTTSTPALAAIIENGHSSSPLATYAISYPIALITTVFTIRILIKFLDINTEDEEARYRKEVSSKKEKVYTHHFSINNPNVFQKSILDINFNNITDTVISRIQRYGSQTSFIPNEETILNEKDLVKVIGNENSLKSASLVLGAKSSRSIDIDSIDEILSVIVTKPQIIGKPLSELNLDGQWGAEIREIRRAGINLIPKGSTRLRYGDKILCCVNKETSSNLIEILGGVESESIDFLPISLAIVLGVIIGQFSIPIGGTNIGPGITGGILFTTLVLGRIGKTGPMIWSIAGRTNQFLREIGILLFLCGVGSSTGQTLLQSLTQEGIKTIIATVIITSLSILLTSLIAIKFLKMNKLRFLGALAGSFTCSAALPDAKEVNGSSIPLTAYSVTYPFALFITVIMGQVFLLFP